MVRGWLNASLQLAARRGGYEYFCESYKQLFVSLWQKHAGTHSMRIGAAAAREFAQEMIEKGISWELEAEDLDFLDRFQDTEGIPLLAFQLWAEDDDFDSNQWECLASGKRGCSSMQTPSKKKVRKLLEDTLAVVGHIAYQAARHTMDKKYKRTYVNLWERHAGSQSLWISQPSAAAFARDLAAEDLSAPLGPEQHAVLEAISCDGTMSLLAFTAWTESRDFVAHDWLYVP